MTRLGEALTVLVTLQAATVIHLKRQPESAFGRDGGSLQLRHLRYFVKIVEAGSFSRAAATIHVAQPGLSQQIAELEEELGVALLQRHARGISPTAAGEVLYREAVVILRQIEQLPGIVIRPAASLTALWRSACHPR
jgi:DNA-binding transcriptional LysR family regulator